ncbi:MAG: putative DNA repair protein MutK [Neolewinella sp.]|jgi:predicted DNA repair protein MutK
MAAGSLLALFDDIATLLDDISVMSKIAVKKTAGVLGDDLAVNAEQVGNLRAERELPVVWAVAKGSLLNKLIIVPIVLLASLFMPWLITPVLMLGGVYLCFEGAEKIWHAIAHRNTKDHSQTRALLEDSNVDLLSLEKERVKGAIRTDFILSLEIIVIALSTVQQAPFAKQAVVLSIVALGVTFAVYGLVAMIVKIDDLGLYFLKSATAAVKSLGGFLLWLAPVLMKTLTVVGTLAMFLVGGGILTHGVDHYIEFGVALSHLDVFSNAFANGLSQNIFNGLIGMLIGAAVVAVFTTASDKR